MFYKINAEPVESHHWAAKEYQNCVFLGRWSVLFVKGMLRLP